MLILKRLKSLLDGLLNVIERQVKSTTFGVLELLKRLQSLMYRVVVFNRPLPGHLHLKAPCDRAVCR